MMVNGILTKVYKEVRGLHQAAYILALFTFGSQILALVRDRIFAHTFGASVELDLYYTAFRIPDVLYVIFASTLSVYVLIPFVSKHAETSPERVRAFLSQVCTVFIAVYSLIAFAVMVCAPQLVSLFFPGFVAQSDTLVFLIRILLVQPLLLGISSLYGVVAQMERRFLLYALSPLIYNFGIIAGVLILYPYMGIGGLAAGVVVGALGHVAIQIPYVWKHPYFPSCTLTFDWRELGEVARTSLTRVMTLSLHQFVLLGLIGFASIMDAGSVSVFQFAFNLQSVPLAIIGVSYSVATFPLLAHLYAEKNIASFRDHVGTAIRHIMFWALPATALFVVVRAQFVRIVLGTGAFDWSDTRLTAAILAVLILSLTAQAVNLLIVRALYAVGNTRVPFLVTLASSCLAIVCAFGFFVLLNQHAGLYEWMQTATRLEGVRSIEVLALPMGYSLALIVHGVVLTVCARNKIFISIRALVRPFAESCIAALACGVASYLSLNYFVLHATADTLMTVLAQGMFASGVGLGAYVLTHWFFGNRELREIHRSLTKKFVRSSMVFPQDEDTLSV